jgi:adenine-specific DNA-methyltransferase
MGDRKNPQYSIFYNGDEIKPEKQWVWEKERLLKAIENDEVVFNKMEDGKYSVRSKQYLKDENGKIRNGKPLSLINGPFNQEGTLEVKKLFGFEAFSFPKPVSLIKYFLSFTINEKSDKSGILLDFFAGSNTSAQAVLDLNMEDGGQRQFICIQLPQPVEENSAIFEAGYKTIAEIGKERIRRVIQKIKKEKESEKGLFRENENLDLGFKVFKLIQSNFKIWNSDVTKTPEAIQEQLFKHIDHISPEAHQEAILYEILLKSGFELTTQIEKREIEGKTVFSIADAELLVCLEKDLNQKLIKAIAEHKPSRVICLDEGFHNNDQLKTNAVQIMKSKGVVKFQTV